ncbi:MAG TPA: class I SAM-dependent methyltransferase [Roseivirga sp.]
MKRISLFILVSAVCLSCQKKQETQNGTQLKPERPTIQNVEPEVLEPVFPEDLAEERTDWQNPDIVLRSFSDLSSKIIADIGAGAGYFSFKLARVARKVIALDIDPNALEYINEQKEIVGDWAERIETRLTPPDVPNLLQNETQAVLVVNTFAFIPDQKAYFERLRESIQPDGELVIVDFKKGDIPVGPSDDRKLDATEVRSILRKAGYRKITIDNESLEYQYIIKAVN